MVQERANDRVYILKFNDRDSDGTLEWIGTLYEERAEDGELLEMFIEPFEGQELIGDNLLYFGKRGATTYVYADFEAYPDTIELDDPDGLDAGELEKVLKEAEATIRLVRESKPIQVQSQFRNDDGELNPLDIRNETRRERNHHRKT